METNLLIYIYMYVCMYLCMYINYNKKNLLNHMGEYVN